MKKRIAFLVLTALLFGAGGLAFALDQWTGQGEVVDMHCYGKDPNKKGEAHAGCAKKCLGAADGSMGLLMSDGKVVKLVPGSDQAAYKALVDLAGKQAKVTGENKDGVVTVATSAPAA